jgi:F0F1-type ATP synthase membrane subunit a
MTLIEKALTLFCWILSVNYLLCIGVVLLASWAKVKAPIKPPLTWVGPLAICFLVAKYLI